MFNIDSNINNTRGLSIYIHLAIVIGNINKIIFYKCNFSGGFKDFLIVIPKFNHKIKKSKVEIKPPGPSENKLIDTKAGVATVLPMDSLRPSIMACILNTLNTPICCKF